MKQGIAGPPIRYEAVAECLQEVVVKAKELRASVHRPRIGCGLAGVQWSHVEPIILENLCSQGGPSRFMILNRATAMIRPRHELATIDIASEWLDNATPYHST